MYTTMKILCEVIEVDGYKWSLACPIRCCRCALPRNVRRRFGNHSNLTADAAPDRGQRQRWWAAEVAKTKTNGHSIHKISGGDVDVCMCACDCEYLSIIIIHEELCRRARHRRRHRVFHSCCRWPTADSHVIFRLVSFFVFSFYFLYL